jgi:glycosyltransferase involved in cell wall biosynthesis
VDAVAIVSQFEGFPMVAVEAGFLGVPVIATRVGALPELFADEIAFVDLDEGAPALGSMRAALARIQADGSDLGRRLHTQVARLCDPAAVAAGYARVLRDAVEKRVAQEGA